MPKLFSNALITVTPLALIGVWGELLEAYHGVNGYGSNVAEIYAYRLMRYSPTFDLAPSLDYSERIKAEITTQAANALCAIIDEFASQYPCEVEIDGISLEEWNELVNFGEFVFDHRCHVRITKETQ